MKKVHYILMFSFILFIVSAGCSSRRTCLEDVGLLKKHKLIRSNKFIAGKGSLSGSFFLGSGNINGSISSEYVLQFWWIDENGKIISTTLPYSKFVFEIDNTKNSPSVEFVFNRSWLKYFMLTPAERKNIRYDIINPNTFVMSDNLLCVKVVISRSTLEKEIYLPKIN